MMFINLLPLKRAPISNRAHRSPYKINGVRRIKVIDAIQESTRVDNEQAFPWWLRRAIEEAPSLIVDEGNSAPLNPDLWSEEDEHEFLVNGYFYRNYRIEGQYVIMMKRLTAEVRRRSRESTTLLTR